MRFETIVVPRGAEFRAVERGWARPRPALLGVSAGSMAGASLPSGRFAATALVLGVCGALDPALRVGDPVVYARVFSGTETIELDTELAAACAVACDRTPLAAADVPHVISAPAAKAALRAATGAAAIDMEAASLARALHARGVRVAMVRVVSDDAAGELPDLAAIYDPHGTLRPGALAMTLARHPGRGFRFIANALRALGALRVISARLAETAG